MSVESATYISQLVPANPAGADPVSDGATHLRLVKSVLQSTFPNLGATAVTSTAVQLNGALCPIGMVAMWYGSIGTIPAGWVLCTGGTYSRTDGGGNITTPVLYDKFMVGAGNSYGVGATGGIATNIPAGAVGAYSLVTGDLPAHNHGISDPGHSHGVTDPGHGHSYNQAAGGLFAVVGSGVQSFSGNTGATTGTSGTNISINAAGTGITTTNTGSGNGHAHSFSGYGLDNRPPYYGIAYIMKI